MRRLLSGMRVTMRRRKLIFRILYGKRRKILTFGMIDLQTNIT